MTCLQQSSPCSGKQEKAGTFFSGWIQNTLPSPHLCCCLELSSPWVCPFLEGSKGSITLRTEEIALWDSVKNQIICWLCYDPAWNDRNKSGVSRDFPRPNRHSHSIGLLTIIYSQQWHSVHGSGSVWFQGELRPTQQTKPNLGFGSPLTCSRKRKQRNDTVWPPWSKNTGEKKASQNNRQLTPTCSALHTHARL